jgi:hypothetical protein
MAATSHCHRLSGKDVVRFHQMQNGGLDFQSRHKVKVCFL